MAEVSDLRVAEGVGFAAAAGVDGVELEGEDCWRRGAGGGGIGFVREEARDEAFLEVGGVGVASEAGEVEVVEVHVLFEMMVNV